MRKIFAAGALALALLSGCQAAPESGKVLDKEYTPASTENECKGSGKKRTCKLDYDPAVCQLQLDDNGNIGWVEIPCELYDKYEAGDTYPKGN